MEMQLVFNMQEHQLLKEILLKLEREVQLEHLMMESIHCLVIT